MVRNRDHYRIAVLIPCRNEESTIAQVVECFSQELPDAAIVVIDNSSDDATRSIARASGASVLSQQLVGKGNAVRKAFAEVDADVYLMVDGDGTYDASIATKMVEPIMNREADMVVANRIFDAGKSHERRGHSMGNRIFTKLTHVLFGVDVTDALSGYRAFSRKFVKSLPIDSQGFEIEIELNAAAGLLPIEIINVASKYRNRGPDSFSKLRTFRDGWRILRALFRAYRAFAPARFFGSFSVLTLCCSIALYTGSFGATSFMQSAAPLMFGVSVLLFLAGIILNSQSRLQRQLRRLQFVSTSIKTSDA